MRRKRLQHHADTLCHIFCGWEIMVDWTNLTRLREGRLEIDLLEGTCRHNGYSIAPLEMNQILKNWFHKDLQENNIPIECIKKAMLEINFQCELSSKIDSNINCRICCNSLIQTDEKLYSSVFRDCESWSFKGLPHRRELESLYQT